MHKVQKDWVFVAATRIRDPIIGALSFGSVVRSIHGTFQSGKRLKAGVSSIQSARYSYV
jgi:hypothetical protein